MSSSGWVGRVRGACKEGFNKCEERADDGGSGWSIKGVCPPEEAVAEVCGGQVAK